MTVQLPVTLPNVEEIEAGFVRAMDLYTIAFAKIEEADRAIKMAYAAVEAVTPGAAFHDSNDAREIGEFNKAVQLPSRDLYLRTARKLINVRCWHYVVDRCGMRQLMDAQATKEFDAQLRYVPDRPKHHRELIDEDEAAKGPPEFTAENVRSTLATFAGQAQTIWRRGIANAFSKLDRRFRSHDGFKIGSRLILTRLANDWGSIDTYGNRADTFRDIERTLHILDGRDPRHAQANFLHQLDQERRDMPRNGRSLMTGWQSEHDSPYFKVRIFKNGNAHLWFTRDDLVELVNKELAAYYGEVIGDGQTQEADPLESRALTPARLFGFYPTPNDIADGVVAKVPWRKPLRILEPSAGTGNLAFRLAKPVEWRDEDGTVAHRVDAVEIQPELASALRASGKLNRVITADFLALTPEQIYDGVVMNPPFDRERDIDHVTQALKWLKPDGWLLAIMSAGVEFRETRKAAAFRKLVDGRKGWIVDLPAGAFAEVGTHVNTVLVGIGLFRSYHFG